MHQLPHIRYFPSLHVAEITPTPPQKVVIEFQLYSSACTLTYWPDGGAFQPPNLSYVMELTKY